MVKVIATDLDGTLLKPKRKYSLVAKENKKFIKNFYGDIVLVTGRGPKFCSKVATCLNIEHHFVAYNGAVIVKNGNIIYTKSVKKTPLISMITYLEENYNDFQFLLFDKYDYITCYSPIKKSILKRNNFIRHLKNGRLYEKVLVSNKKAKKILSDSTDIFKAVIYSNNTQQITCCLKEKYGEHFEFFTNNYSIEISPIGISKGNSLQYLLNTTNVKNDETLVVGDGVNDISLFELFENSFAINNGEPGLKAKAKKTIDNFSDLHVYTKLNGNFH